MDLRPTIQRGCAILVLISTVITASCGGGGGGGDGPDTSTPPVVTGPVLPPPTTDPVVPPPANANTVTLKQDRFRMPDSAQYEGAEYLEDTMTLRVPGYLVASPGDLIPTKEGTYKVVSSSLVGNDTVFAVEYPALTDLYTELDIAPELNLAAAELIVDDDLTQTPAVAKVGQKIQVARAAADPTTIEVSLNDVNGLRSLAVNVKRDIFTATFEFTPIDLQLRLNGPNVFKADISAKTKVDVIKGRIPKLTIGFIRIPLTNVSGYVRLGLFYDVDMSLSTTLIPMYFEKRVHIDWGGEPGELDASAPSSQLTLDDVVAALSPAVGAEVKAKIGINFYPEVKLILTPKWLADLANPFWEDSIYTNPLTIEPKLSLGMSGTVGGCVAIAPSSGQGFYGEFKRFAGVEVSGNLGNITKVILNKSYEWPQFSKPKPDACKGLPVPSSPGFWEGTYANETCTELPDNTYKWYWEHPCAVVGPIGADKGKFYFSDASDNAHVVFGANYNSSFENVRVTMPLSWKSNDDFFELSVPTAYRRSVRSSESNGAAGWVYKTVKGDGIRTTRFTVTTRSPTRISGTFKVETVSGYSDYWDLVYDSWKTVPTSGSGSWYAEKREGSRPNPVMNGYDFCFSDNSAAVQPEVTEDAGSRPAWNTLVPNACKFNR